MTRHTTANSESRKVRNDQDKLVTALQTLFDLLEDYAPRWYTKKHRDLVSDALASATGRRSRSSLRGRLKDVA
jgi:hypothetical protein